MSTKDLNDLNDSSDLNELQLQRHQKLKKLISSSENPFKSYFHRTHLIAQIIQAYQSLEPGETAGAEGEVSLAGRLKARREHGKVSFADIEDGSGKIQLYITLDDLGAEDYHRFLDLDIGDILGVKGGIFKTKRGELSLQVKEFELLTKSLRPLPEKWHGLRDIETRYRQRYVDLIMSPQVKETFVIRSKVIKAIRKFLDSQEFLEVDTPILQQIPGGATATPFSTFHEALNMELYLRIAPELYLKRLLVGGMEKVYELGRNFRNEGISVKHNPEFTMLEVYWAYVDYREMIHLLEDLVRYVIKEVLGTLKVSYQGEELDFQGSWEKLTMLEAIEKYLGIEVSFDLSLEELKGIAGEHHLEIEPPFGKGKVIAEIFEKLVENKLVQPTIILDYPREISPLARRHPENENLTERFELIVAGREIANAFSELTDPLEQRKRFEEQLAYSQEEDIPPQRIDEDFLRALEYGMPPAGGLGLGVDRLVMLLTDAYSLRDVLLFPHLRPEK